MKIEPKDMFDSKKVTLFWSEILTEVEKELDILALDTVFAFSTELMNGSKRYIRFERTGEFSAKVESTDYPDMVFAAEDTGEMWFDYMFLHTIGMNIEVAIILNTLHGTVGMSIPHDYIAGLATGGIDVPELLEMYDINALIEELS